MKLKIAASAATVVLLTSGVAAAAYQIPGVPVGC